MHRLPGQAGEVVAFCAGLPGPVRMAYEAGSTGFGLARALLAAGPAARWRRWGSSSSLSPARKRRCWTISARSTG